MHRINRYLIGKLYDIKLKNKLLMVYFALLFIPIVFTNALFYNKISENVKADNKAQIYRSIEKTKNEFTRLINTGMTLSHAIYTDNNLYEMLDRQYSDLEEYYVYFDKYLRGLMKKYLLAFSNIEDISIYSANNTILTADTYFKLDDEVRQNEWYKKLQTIRNKILVYSYASPNPPFTDINVSIIRKLDNIPDGIEKILKIDMNFKVISQIISDSNLDGEIFLVNDDNNIVYSTDRSYMSGMDSLISFDNIKLDHGEFTIEVGLDDTTSLSNWRIIGVFTEFGINDSLLSALGFVGILSIISLTAASLAIKLISKSFNDRIITISRHMEKVKNQEFEPIGEEGGADEIGQLMSDFNSMALRIKKLIQDVYEADIQKKNLELERKQAELNALQSQIDPHFLFNTLESIRIRSLMKDETETADIVKCLSKTFRRMLVWGNDLITVRTEIEYINDYLRIQKYRFSEKLNYNMYVQDEALNCKILKMTIQPFIENSCIHGIEDKTGDGCISLNIKKADGKLAIMIEDNGCGMHPDKLNSIITTLQQESDINSANIGIKNVYNRLKLFYGKDFEFNMESRPNEGTKVYISIPANE